MFLFDFFTRNSDVISVNYCYVCQKGICRLFCDFVSLEPDIADIMYYIRMVILKLLILDMVR